MTTETLIKPATIQEQLLGKISEMRQRNLTAGQKQRIKYLKERVKDKFMKLVWQYFGLSITQVQELSDQELEVLFLLVFERTAKTARCLKVIAGFGCVIPVAGWLMAGMIFDNSETIKFVSSVREIKKMLGDSFSPYQILRGNM